MGLTDLGLHTIDRAVEGHLANEVRLLAALPERDRTSLDRILRTLLTTLEQQPGDPAPSPG